MQEVYRLPERLRPAGVLVDLGANIGMASVWYSRRYGIDRVVAVEPVPANVAILRKNLAANSVANEIVRATVGPREARCRSRPTSAPVKATSSRVVPAISPSKWSRWTTYWRM